MINEEIAEFNREAVWSKKVFMKKLIKLKQEKK